MISFTIWTQNYNLYNDHREKCDESEVVLNRLLVFQRSIPQNRPFIENWPNVLSEDFRIKPTSTGQNFKMKNLVLLFTVGLAKSTREVLDEDFENLVKQVQLLEATVEGLEDQNASTIKQIADLEAAAEDHEEKIQELEGQVNALEDEVESLNEKVSRLEVSKGS